MTERERLAHAGALCGRRSLKAKQHFEVFMLEMLEKIVKRKFVKIRE